MRFGSLINQSEKLLGKHCKVNLDLNDLKKARNPRLTQRATKQVSVLWRDQRKETFVNLGLLLLIDPQCLVMAFISHT